MPPTDDSPARVALGTYTDAERATQAEARLQTTGLWTAREAVPAAAKPPAASNKTAADAAPETVVLYVRPRDVRKAQGVLQAVHLQPDATPDAAAALRSVHRAAPTTTTAGESDVESDTEPDTATEPAPESDAHPDTSASADWMPHIRFTHMVIGGAIVLALATALFLWMQASAG